MLLWEIRDLTLYKKGEKKIFSQLIIMQVSVFLQKNEYYGKSNNEDKLHLLRGFLSYEQGNI